MTAGSESVCYLIMNDAMGNRQRYRLFPQQVMNIGRAATNRVVLNDEVCSRNHCEVFHTSSGWKIRDRDSRNGTFVNNTQVTQDQPLHTGDIIRIGTSQLLFTVDANAQSVPELPAADNDTATDLPVMTDAPPELPEILRRQKRSTYRDINIAETRQSPRSGVKLSRLYQMALDMGNAQSAQGLAEIVLNGLVGMTGADIGAVLTRPDYASLTASDGKDPLNLAITSYRSLNGETYRKVSNSLSQRVFTSREAILARDIHAHSGLAGARDSLNELQAESLIVAPIHDDNDFFGLIHLYSTNPENPLDADGLDYTLAVADQLAIALKNLQQRQKLQEGLRRIKKENLQLRQQLAIESELVGQSQAMHRLRETISLVAPTDAVVLIRGESGVGKELVARAIHLNSLRKENPFICMNCAALSESLLESELFGHEKGSFTGATGLKHGKFEHANNGTLFLDEVGEMSPAIQAKFLRVMEGHPFERVGGSQTIQVNVRIVAATNRNLEEAVREMSFRKDLYFRLQVLEILVPPLRQRQEDIPLLAQFFAERLAGKTGRPIRGFTPDAMDKLVRYNWPGNVRELQNTVERSVVLCTGNLIETSHVQLSKLSPGELLESQPVSTPVAAAPPDYSELSIEELEKEHILRTLELTQGNKSKASQILGIERSTLDRKLRKYGVKVIKEA